MPIVSRNRVVILDADSEVLTPTATDKKLRCQPQTDRATRCVSRNRNQSKCVVERGSVCGGVSTLASVNNGSRRRRCALRTRYDPTSVRLSVCPSHVKCVCACVGDRVLIDLGVGEQRFTSTPVCLAHAL